MKAFTVLFSLAMAATALASAIDTRLLEPVSTERTCGKAGAPCTTGDDCCVYCDPWAGQCLATSGACIEKGTVPVYGQNDCCSYKVDAQGRCT